MSNRITAHPNDGGPIRWLKDGGAIEWQKEERESMPGIIQRGLRAYLQLKADWHRKGEYIYVIDANRHNSGQWSVWGEMHALRHDDDDGQMMPSLLVKLQAHAYANDVDGLNDATWKVVHRLEAIGNMMKKGGAI